MRRDLEHCRLLAGIDHRPEQALQFGGLRRRIVHFGQLAIDPATQSTQITAGQSGAFERAAQQKGGRRLAIGPGDADVEHRAPRIGVKVRGQPRQRRAAVGDPHSGRRPAIYQVFDHHGPGAAGNGVADEEVAVLLLPPAYRYEEIPCHNLPRIADDSFQVDIPLPIDAGAGQYGKEIVQFHARCLSPPPRAVGRPNGRGAHPIPPRRRAARERTQCAHRARRCPAGAFARRPHYPCP